LEARENELRRREEELRQRNLRTDGHQNNWPPLPSFVPFGPCFYQDIDVEIPLEYRQIVRFGYYLWLGHVGVFLFNVIAAIAYLIGSGGNATAGSTFGLSIVFAALFIPASFVCWFRPLYKAFRSDSSFYYFFFFIVFGAQIFVIFIQSLGINFFAGCGWINGIFTLSESRGAGALMIICGLIFTILGVMDVLLIMRVHRIYRGSGASFEKAKVEFSQGIMSNTAVRSAAMEAGTAAVRGGVAGSTGRF
jgi:secretory carrier-associated membrane protein